MRHLGFGASRTRPHTPTLATCPPACLPAWRQVIYAIKTRNGEVFLRLRKNNGDMSCFEEEELTEAELQFKAERGGGNYGAGTKEMQVGGRGGWVGVWSGENVISGSAWQLECVCRGV